jgi:hypothetical protein
MNFSKKNHELKNKYRHAVSNTKLTFLLVFLSGILLAQNGINYKALIKDTNGNALSSSPISIQFIIYEGQALTNNVYQESHTINTDANGFVVINIGEGTTNNVFTDIDWANDEHFLNVQINTGTGLEDLGTTQFRTVPYAIQSKKAANVTGIEAIDEGNGKAWRLIGKNSDNYGNIGENAIDLSESQVATTEHGATGDFSSSFGVNTTAFGLASTAFGIATNATGNISFAMGSVSTASGDYATAFGQSTTASGNFSTVFGASNEASGDYSMAVGRGLTTNYNSIAIGRYNVGIVSPASWVDITPLFEIGNGTSNSDRHNALTVYKNGRMNVSSSSNGLSIFSSNQYGINVADGNSYGILANGDIYGGYFEGDSAAIFAEATINSDPDIILGGDSGNTNDDGIIASDPDFAGSDIYLRSNDAVVIQLDHDDSSNGSFIVRDSDNDNVFSVNESGNATLSGSLTQNSDRRLKKNIDDLHYGLNEILQLQPKQYFWKNQEQDKKSLGLIAQDVQPIINEIVNTQDDKLKTLGVNYIELIPVLIKAIQEQQKTIETLNAKNGNQDSKLKSIEQHYQSLLSRIEHIESKSSH